jgi:hypothetical protein
MSSILERLRTLVVFNFLPGGWSITLLAIQILPAHFRQHITVTEQVQVRGQLRLG